MSEAVYRATQTITPNDLSRMVLPQRDLPSALRDFLLTRENPLDNETMAQQGFPGSTAERFRALGRITGYLREFAAPRGQLAVRLGTDGHHCQGYILIQAAGILRIYSDPARDVNWSRGFSRSQYQRTA